MTGIKLGYLYILECTFLLFPIIYKLIKPFAYSNRPRIPVTLNMKMTMPSW